MKFYEKVISIVTIPNRTENATNYEKWKNGDGQLLLPFFLICTVIFCILCAIIQSTLWLIIKCVQWIIGEESEIDEEEENGEEMESEKNLITSSKKEEEPNASEPEFGTPRSRKLLSNQPSPSSAHKYSV